MGSREDLQRAADLLRVGLAGSLQSSRMRTFDGSVKALADIGQGAGFASQPSGVVNYVENHDNPTLFDIKVMKLPAGTPREDRVRVQVLGAAVTTFSQAIAYFHAGLEWLRSKSFDRNSFNSGDCFNRLDFTLQDPGYGSGLPPQAYNGALWPAMEALLAVASIKSTAADIRFTRDTFLDLLRAHGRGLRAGLKRRRRHRRLHMHLRLVGQAGRCRARPHALTLALPQCPACTFSPAFSRYTVPQYGQRPMPSVATSMKTLGWLLHSGMRGLGQKVTPGPSRSAAVSSTVALVSLLIRQPASAIRRTWGCGH